MTNLQRQRTKRRDKPNEEPNEELNIELKMINIGLTSKRRQKEDT